MALTITEALAEIKTIGKRIDKRRAGVMPFLARQDGIKDPLAAQGGSDGFVAAERQGIRDMEERIILLRRGIQRANDETAITVEGQTRSISEWLTWRRDVASGQAAFLKSLRDHINNVRSQAQRSGAQVVAAGAAATAPSDFVINLNEADLAKQTDALENVLGSLDGQLSLKNATVIIQE